MNSGLAPFGKLVFTNDGVKFDGDISPLVGLEVEVRPIKVQAKTIFKTIAKLDTGKAKTVTDADFMYGNGTVSELAATLKGMNANTREMAVNALAGANPEKYDGLLSFISSKTPGKVDFTVQGQK